MKVVIRCANRYGYYETPNGCWYFYRTAEVKDIDIASGKYVLKNVSGLKDSCENGDAQLDPDTVRTIYDFQMKEEVKNYKTIQKKIELA